MPEFTLLISYYNQPLMLRRHLQEWAAYANDVPCIVVDDGSATPAAPIVRKYAAPELKHRLRVYRILEDVPWNRGEARNLGAQEAHTQWIVQTDIDHILPVPSAKRLWEFAPKPRAWYRFARFRVGAADETRRKDTLPDACTFGQIHPHIDSYLIERQMFLESPYDESYSGLLGGGSPFLKRMEAKAAAQLLPDPICLHVYTRHVIPDASVTGLSRDTGPYARLRKEKERRGETEPGRTLRIPWERVL